MWNSQNIISSKCDWYNILNKNFCSSLHCSKSNMHISCSKCCSVRITHFECSGIPWLSYWIAQSWRQSEEVTFCCSDGTPWPRPPVEGTVYSGLQFHSGEEGVAAGSRSGRAAERLHRPPRTRGRVNCLKHFIHKNHITAFVVTEVLRALRKAWHVTTLSRLCWNYGNWGSSSFSLLMAGLQAQNGAPGWGRCTQSSQQSMEVPPIFSVPKEEKAGRYKAQAHPRPCTEISFQTQSSQKQHRTQCSLLPFPVVNFPFTSQQPLIIRDCKTIVF